MRRLSLSVQQEARLRRELKRNENVTCYRRAVALLAVHEGHSVVQVAELLGVTRQSIYNWIANYGHENEDFDLRDALRPGRPPLVTQALRGMLASAFRQAPEELGFAVENWTTKLLREHLLAQSGREFCKETLRLHVRRLGYVYQDGRYVLEPNGRCTKVRTTSEDAT